MYTNCIRVVCNLNVASNAVGGFSEYITMEVSLVILKFINYLNNK